MVLEAASPLLDLPEGLLEREVLPRASLLSLLGLRASSRALRAAAQAELARRPKLFAVGEAGSPSRAVTLLFDWVTSKWKLNYLPPPHLDWFMTAAFAQLSPTEVVMCGGVIPDDEEDEEDAELFDEGLTRLIPGSPLPGYSREERDEVRRAAVEAIRQLGYSM
jgi:hypothetical protein